MRAKLRSIAFRPVALSTIGDRNGVSCIAPLESQVDSILLFFEWLFAF